MRLITRNSYTNFAFGDSIRRQAIIDWKKAGNKAMVAKLSPPKLTVDFSDLGELLAAEGLYDVDIITCPPPSFHDYAKDGGWYPAEVLALAVLDPLDLPLTLLWPMTDHQKAKKIIEGNINKIYPVPDGVRGKVVLVLDDIGTTGHTLAACCDAICQGGGYPLGVSFV
ncbi:MAG TPA: phosphoribosyltransferase [Myxococcota bacterium]|nr:phosphoribosyltransferase [Myxococcota bacterium]